MKNHPGQSFSAAETLAPADRDVEWDALGCGPAGALDVRSGISEDLFRGLFWPLLR